MPETLTDEQILEIDDAPLSESTAESTTESTTGQSGDESQQQTTDSESQGNEQQVADEERQPAQYQDLGTAEELRELVDADRMIFSADRADNQAWLQKFSTDHKDAFNRLFDLSIAHVQSSNPTKWAQIQQDIVQNALTTDKIWDFLEGAFAANANNPAAQQVLDQLAQYLNTRFGLGPAQQNTHPGFDQPTRDAINNDLEKFFEAEIDKSLPHLSELPAHSRALVLRKIHAEIQSDIKADENYKAALSRVLRSGTADALDRAIAMIARRGLSALPAIAKRWGETVPPPLRQGEANAMSDRAILDSNRPVTFRPARAQNRATKLTRDEVNRIDPRKLLDYGPVTVRR